MNKSKMRSKSVEYPKFGSNYTPCFLFCCLRGPIKMDIGMHPAKVRMSGYLHLKVKKRMISSWKSYWFVLEDRLLLYYRSKDEYDGAISPCKGSINLGPPCTVKSLPSVANSFQIETRTVTYTLKSDNSADQKKWMHAILSALNQNQNFSETPKRLSHFRYSLDDLIPPSEPNDPQKFQKPPLERQNTMPHRLKADESKNTDIIQRLQKLGAQSYGGSLGAISKIATKKVTGTTSRKGGNASQGSLPSCLFNEEDEDEGSCIYERISGDSEGFVVDSEGYSVPLRKSMSVVEERKGSRGRETKSLMVENDQYGMTRHIQSDEVIYAEPKINEITDCNKNSVCIENTLYATADITTDENVYEDLDNLRIYSGSSSHSSVEEKKTNPGKKIKKSKSFIKRVWKRKKKKNDEKKVEEEIYAEIDVGAVDKVTINDGSAVKMLSELHNILEHKKSKLKASSSNNLSMHSDSEQSSPKPTSTTNSELECPTLPPKTHKTSQERPLENVRSLDEILDDLDKEKLESKGKVQMLIEKFSEAESDDVILRKHDKSSDSKNYRHSDDLNTLLDELAKVTSAPIMTPGVTTSLVNPNLTDEEWLKLLPVRQRRLSEPDYDVPRPHKSIQLPEKSDNSDAIPVTRFFGPVLPPAITDNKDDSLCVSMTPDSLEVEDSQKFQTHCSYSSHHYADLKTFGDYNMKDDKIIYAMPKSYLSVATRIVNTCQNLCGGHLTDECTIVYKNVRNVDVHEEIFNDSLELCNETKSHL